LFTLIRITIRLIGVALIVLLAAPVAWQLFSGDTYLTVTGHSMEPTYDIGDVLVVKRPTGQELEHKGQIVVVTFGANALETGQGQYVHRVYQPTPTGAWLKGDNNAVADPHEVTPAQVIGTPRLLLPGNVGAAFMALQTLAGRASLLVLILAALLVPLPRKLQVTPVPEQAAAPECAAEPDLFRL